MKIILIVVIILSGGEDDDDCGRDIRCLLAAATHLFPGDQPVRVDCGPVLHPTCLSGHLLACHEQLHVQPHHILLDECQVSFGVSLTSASMGDRSVSLSILVRKAYTQQQSNFSTFFSGFGWVSNMCFAGCHASSWAVRSVQPTWWWAALLHVPCLRQQNTSAMDPPCTQWQRAWMKHPTLQLHTRTGRHPIPACACALSRTSGSPQRTVCEWCHGSLGLQEVRRGLLVNDVGCFRE